jgi:hypothetical protein
MVFFNLGGSFKGSPLPTNLNSRKIIKLDDGSFLVVSSNNKSYRMAIKSN